MYSMIFGLSMVTIRVYVKFGLAVASINLHFMANKV